MKGRYAMITFVYVCYNSNISYSSSLEWCTGITTQYKTAPKVTVQDNDTGWKFRLVVVAPTLPPSNIAPNNTDLMLPPQQPLWTSHIQVRKGSLVKIHCAYFSLLTILLSTQQWIISHLLSIELVLSLWAVLYYTKWSWFRYKLFANLQAIQKQKTNTFDLI